MGAITCKSAREQKHTNVSKDRERAGKHNAKTKCCELGGRASLCVGRSVVLAGVNANLLSLVSQFQLFLLFLDSIQI